mmetsp:Transcript_6974/g.20202  ORF Transcript_6974/g.20202 Transcript_6974/m.20202 type:complete len:214 (+) Transcript_6974:6226-6867(+)
MQYSVTGLRHMVPAKNETASARAQSHPSNADPYTSSLSRRPWHICSGGMVEGSVEASSTSTSPLTSPLTSPSPPLVWSRSATGNWQVLPVNPDGHRQVSTSVPPWARRERSSAVPRRNRQYPPLAQNSWQLENFQSGGGGGAAANAAGGSSVPNSNAEGEAWAAAASINSSSGSMPRGLIRFHGSEKNIIVETTRMEHSSTSSFYRSIWLRRC